MNLQTKPNDALEVYKILAIVNIFYQLAKALPFNHKLCKGIFSGIKYFISYCIRWNFIVKTFDMKFSIFNKILILVVSAAADGTHLVGKRFFISHNYTCEILSLQCVDFIDYFFHKRQHCITPIVFVSTARKHEVFISIFRQMPKMPKRL